MPCEVGEQPYPHCAHSGAKNLGPPGSDTARNATWILLIPASEQTTSQPSKECDKLASPDKHLIPTFFAL